MMGNDGDDACSLGNHVDHLFEHLWLTTPHARLRASVWAPVSKHIMSRYGVLPWLWPPSKAWLVDPMIGLSRHVKDLTSPHPHVLKLVALVAGGRTATGSGLCVVADGLCEVCIAPISMLPLLSHASLCFVGAQWEVVCCMA